MYYGGICGGGCNCGPVTKEDEVTFLREKEKIMEAKLATIRHLIESLESEKETKK